MGIHRLQVLLLRAHHLQQAYGGGCHTSHMQILDIFRAEIRDELCIEEGEAWEREFFELSMQSVYACKKNRRD